MGTILFAVGILADLISANRSLLEDIRAREMLRGPKTLAEPVPLHKTRAGTLG